MTASTSDIGPKPGGPTHPTPTGPKPPTKAAFESAVADIRAAYARIQTTRGTTSGANPAVTSDRASGRAGGWSAPGVPEEFAVGVAPMSGRGFSLPTPPRLTFDEGRHRLVGRVQP